MPTLIQQKPRTGSAGLLVLRLAVAGVLAWAGWNRLSGDAKPVADNTPIVQPGDPVSESLTQLKEITAPLRESKDTTATADDKGIEVNVDWNDAKGYAELGFAFVLLLGFFTRFVSLVGLTAVGGSAMAANDMVSLPHTLDPLVRMFEANPAAALLLGAIFLALFFGGSGPAAFDSLRRNRKYKRASAGKDMIETA